MKSRQVPFFLYWRVENVQFWINSIGHLGWLSCISNFPRFHKNVNSLELWKYSWFSLVMWWKLKTVTIQWIKSRVRDTIDDWYINNLAKNQVFAVFHSRVICRSVSPKFIELCMETPCLCPSEGHKYGGRKVTETSVTEFCYWNEKLWL